MKPLQFTVPVGTEKTIIVQEDIQQDFYPHLHRHKEAQLIWIVKGQGTLIVDNSMHAFQPNDVFLLSPEQAHVFKTSISDNGNPQEGVHSISVFYDPEGLLSKLLQLPELTQLNSFFKEYKGGFKLNPSYFKLVSARMKRLKNASNMDQFFHFLSLLRLFCKMNPKPDALSSIPTYEKVSEREGLRMATVYNYIATHFHRDITLEEVAAQAHMTTQAFCRYFKKHMGVTFITFLNKVRIEEACKLLTNGVYNSISTVAYNSGFNSITNFNRVFKSVSGQSPKEYLDKYYGNIG